MFQVTVRLAGETENNALRPGNLILLINLSLSCPETGRMYERNKVRTQLWTLFPFVLLLLLLMFCLLPCNQSRLNEVLWVG